MPLPFPSYEKELLTFIEITPEYARKELRWLCRDVNNEGVSEYSLCGEGRHKEVRKEDDQGRRQELVSSGRGNNERVIPKGIKNKGKTKKGE